MAVINLLICQYNDYLWDYPRFFSANCKLLNDHGISMPWLEKDWTGNTWQPRLNEILASAGVSRSDGRTYLSRELAGRQNLLLCGPVGNLLGIDRLTELLRTISGWEQPEIHCVWLAAPKSMEIEGAYRQRPAMETKKILHAQLDKGPNAWLESLEKTLEAAKTVKIIPDVQLGHLTAARLAQALRLPLDSALLPKVEDMRLNSRPVFWAARKIRTMLHLDQKTVVDALKPYDAELIQPFLEPDFLADYDVQYNGEMEKIARKFGSQINLDRNGLDFNDWRPYTPGQRDEWRKIARVMTQALPVAEGETARRIFSHAPQIMWPGFERVAVGEPPVEISVLTLAKNQEKYITECMESVSMQKTRFPLRHIIVDDGSSDDTAGIIMRYAQSHPHVLPLLLGRPRPDGENVRCLFEACRSRYAALCDGDDYFTDELKLQKQTDFLESHPQFALSFHPVDVLYEDGSPARVYPPAEMLPGGEKPFYTLKDLLYANIIQTNSVVYRWRFTAGLPEWFAADLVPGDWYWHILHAENGAIGYMPEHMAVYRRHAASLYATADIDHVIHRRKHGMKELQVYDVLDRHFRRKFHPELARFAIGVLSDLTEVYMKTGDSAPLFDACQRFPVFGREFLGELGIAARKLA